jgi:hypothetical protein
MIHRKLRLTIPSEAIGKLTSKSWYRHLLPGGNFFRQKGCVLESFLTQFKSYVSIFLQYFFY